MSSATASSPTKPASGNRLGEAFKYLKASQLAVEHQLKAWLLKQKPRWEKLIDEGKDEEYWVIITEICDFLNVHVPHSDFAEQVFRGHFATPFSLGECHFLCTNVFWVNTARHWTDNDERWGGAMRKWEMQDDMVDYTKPICPYLPYGDRICRTNLRCDGRRDHLLQYNDRRWIAHRDEKLGRTPAAEGAEGADEESDDAECANALESEDQEPDAP